MVHSDCIIDELDALGCKVTHDLIHPAMCIIGDEVGGNINMSSGGYTGGEKSLCEKDSVPQQKHQRETNTSPCSPLYCLMAIPSCVL